MSLDQIGIMLTGVIAVWLTQSANEERRRYACLFGLAGQPFWFYAAFTGAQWGVFVVCVLYTLAWLRGLQTHWLTPREMVLEKPRTNFDWGEFYAEEEEAPHG
ncbi:MAG: hypothetical protein RLW61_14340 [Gammaproteobacteria bacterium]